MTKGGGGLRPPKKHEIINEQSLMSVLQNDPTLHPKVKCTGVNYNAMQCVSIID